MFHTPKWFRDRVKTFGDKVGDFFREDHNDSDLFAEVLQPAPLHSTPGDRDEISETQEQFIMSNAPIDIFVDTLDIIPPAQPTNYQHCSAQNEQPETTAPDVEERFLDARARMIPPSEQLIQGKTMLHQSRVNNNKEQLNAPPYYSYQSRPETVVCTTENNDIAIANTTTVFISQGIQTKNIDTVPRAPCPATTPADLRPVNNVCERDYYKPTETRVPSLWDFNTPRCETVPKPRLSRPRVNSQVQTPAQNAFVGDSTPPNTAQMGTPYRTPYSNDTPHTVRFMANTPGVSDFAAHSHMNTDITPQIKVPKFKGDDFPNFKRSFENVSFAKDWSDSVKLKQLFGALEGGPAGITGDKPMDEWTYSSLMQALADRYMPVHNQFTLRSKLKTMHQGSQTLQTFMDSIVREVSYANISDTQHANQLIIEVFIDGISNARLKEHLMEAAPRTRHEALRIAIAKDSIHAAAYGAVQKKEPILHKTYVNTSHTDAPDASTTESDIETLKSEVAALRAERDGIKKELDSLQRKGAPASNQPAVTEKPNNQFRGNSRQYNRGRSQYHGVNNFRGNNNNYNSHDRGRGGFVRGRVFNRGRNDGNSYWRNKRNNYGQGNSRNDGNRFNERPSNNFNGQGHDNRTSYNAMGAPPYMYGGVVSPTMYHPVPVYPPPNNNMYPNTTHTHRSDDFPPPVTRNNNPQ